MRHVKILAGLLGAGAILALVGPASAQVEELSFGVAMHDLDLGKNTGKEGGYDIQGEVVFSSPAFLHWALKPRPYLNISINTDGDTNFGGAGLNWKQDFGDSLFGYFSAGLVYDDGITSLPPNPGDPVRIKLAATRALLGSDILFMEQFGLGAHMTGNWDTSVYFQHLSHGKILSSGNNEGLNNVGVKFTYRFD